MLQSPLSQFFSIRFFHRLPVNNHHQYSFIKEKLGQSTDANIVTTFRVYILLFTIVAILAVDFNIFPRHYMKTHKFGASVMDIGVGAFVAANAFASSDAKYKNLFLSLPKLLKKVFPLLVVGFIRWASTAATGYHVDPTEYGIHWNFFMSLAIVHTASIVLIRSFPRIRPGLLAFIIIGKF